MRKAGGHKGDVPADPAQCCPALRPKRGPLSPAVPADILMCNILHFIAAKSEFTRKGGRYG